MKPELTHGLAGRAAPWLGLLGSIALVAALFLSPAARMSAEHGEDTVKVSRQQVQGAVDAALAEDPSLRDQLDALKGQMHDGAVAQSLFVAEAMNQRLADRDYIVRNRLVELQALALYEKAEALVTPEAVAQYYGKNRGRYRSLPRRQIQQIYVPITNLVGEAEARARAENIFKTGRDSMEPSWVTEDGLRKQYGPSLAASIFKLPAGEWSAALRSGVGWHYVKVLQEEPGRPLDLDEAQDQATEDLRRELRNQAYQDEFARLRAKYQVEEVE